MTAGPERFAAALGRPLEVVAYDVVDDLLALVDEADAHDLPGALAAYAYDLQLRALKTDVRGLAQEHARTASSWVEVESAADAHALLHDVDPEVEDRYLSRAPDAPPAARLAERVGLAARVPEAFLEYVAEELHATYEEQFDSLYRDLLDALAAEYLEDHEPALDEGGGR